MNLAEAALIGVALSMDAAAVSVANGLVCKGTKKNVLILDPILFGLFQGIMPLIGFYAVSLLPVSLDKYSGIIMFTVFMALGVKMLLDFFFGNGTEKGDKPLSVGLLLVQAVSTSLDALFVGAALAADAGTDIWLAAAIIAAVTAAVSALCLLAGKKSGALLKDRAGLVGGVLMLFIAVGSLFD